MTSSGWVNDPCHGDVKVGDIVYAKFLGEPSQRFEVLSDTGTGMYVVRRPDGTEAPMRPRTILGVAERIVRA